MTARLLLLLAACQRTERPAPMFETLSPRSTGVAFVNEIPEKPDFNILNYLYYYNGGGVAAGDVDGDGLPDLYFTANLGPNRLYRNKGNLEFEDITDRAGVAAPDGWKTGVAMADVNGDGHLDMYVSSVSYLTEKGHNVLFINNGDGTFTDRTKEYGLEFAGYSTQAAFFDYDCDGDLDMYLLNSSTHTERRIGDRAGRMTPNAASRDRLYRNDPSPDGSGQARHFVDVSDAAGIHDSDHGVEGFGLGVAVADFNLDGCPDLYVGNDFQENDFLYINNCDGTFTESITKATGHTSRFSMGVDAADFDNDGRTDVFVADMLPEREDVLKTSASSEGFNLFNLRLRAGYHPQYPRNTLQLNRGSAVLPRGRSSGQAPQSGQTPRFSEIGYFAGVFATDWSWAPLFADLDNDGRKDLFITSGIYRRPNDLDYINYVGNEAVQASLAKGITRENLPLLERMPQIPLANHAYHNNGDLTFTNRAEEWGLGEPGFSNGAAYVDLDNDGALDLVVNRINAPAAIYHNRARTTNGNGYLTVELRGTRGNTAGVGARVTLKQQGTVQVLEQSLTRGFQSSVDPRLHFGVGSARTIDSLIVVWPDRRSQVLTNVPVNRTITLSQDAAVVQSKAAVILSEPGVIRSKADVILSEAKDLRRPDSGPSPAAFTDVTSQLGVDVRHEENEFLDYGREPLMPHRLSTEGPALAVGDVNGDGLDDVFVGGAKWQPGTLLVQQRGGTFRSIAEPGIAADSIAEDVDAAFFDADGDGDLDLYVVSAGNEFSGQEDALRDRLYVNDGRGAFHRAPNALPALYDNGSCVVPGDFDGDGDIDLFVGSRVVAGKYGVTPRSHLLRNDGKGQFTEVTDEVAPGLGEAGMVTSAAWVGRPGTKTLDLVVVGEWMPVRVFRQENGTLVDRTAEAGLANTEGWWNVVTSADLDADGRPDLILGNLGLNSYIGASPNEPARMYVGDFAHNGTLQQIITLYKHGVSYPVAGRDDLVRLIPSLRSRYPSFASFGASRVEDILPAADLKQATVREARVFASSVAIDRGNGRYELEPLPAEAQFAPVFAAVARDFDGDGRPDLLLGGNLFGVQPVLGRYDASSGVLLHGLGSGRFTSTDRSDQGIEGEVRDMKLVGSAGRGSLIAVARNNATLLLLRPGP
jgi:hypothetical protein